MGLIATVKRAREKLRDVDDAKDEEQRARKRVQRVVSTIQVEKARADLRAAEARRKTEELKAHTALEKARAEASRAGEEKWAARYSKVAAMIRPVTVRLAATAKPKRKPAKRRRATAVTAKSKRKTTTKRKTAAKTKK